MIQNNRQGGTEITYGGGAYINQGIVAVRNNTFINNESLSSGGGLYIAEAATVMIVDNLFSHNHSFVGGGLFINSGSGATIIGNHVQRNHAERGAGIFLGSGPGGPIEIAHNLIENNQATASGGLELSSLFNVHIHHNIIRNNQATTFAGGISDVFNGDSVIIEQNNIEGNQAGTDGGGIYVQFSDSTVRQNIIRNNIAMADGGGLYYSQAHGKLRENWIMHNSAQGRGGAMAISRLPQVTIPTALFAENNVIANNSSTWEAVYILDQNVQSTYWTLVNNGSYGLTASGNSTVTMTNSIVTGHTVAGLNGPITADHILFHSNASQCTGGALCTNIVTGDPRFVNPLQGDYHLDSGSSALNAGINAGVLMDVDGEERPLCGGFDLGADEYSGPRSLQTLSIANVITSTTTLTGTLIWEVAGAENISLRYADILITDDNWDAATVLSDTLPGNTFQYTAVIPYTSNSLYFALKYSDGCGESAVSRNAFWPQKRVYLPLIMYGAVE